MGVFEWQKYMLAALWQRRKPVPFEITAQFRATRYTVEPFEYDYCMNFTKPFLAIACAVLTAGCDTPTEESASEPGLEAKSIRDYSVDASDATSIPMGGFIEFNERVEIDATTGYGNCFFATYEFVFEYDASVFVEFRDGREGHCSYGAVLVRSFEVRVLAEEDYPLGSQLTPFIQFHQSDPNIAVFQIGREYFAERINDLREVEISCRRDSCIGAIERRLSNTSI